jgi:serine phosphatase RsbU (regulator of sigma subunit)/tetratricopeptide (TPR) repeat protein
MTDQVLANRYKVISKLGEGGMGAVFKVEDNLNRDIVAFKILSKQIADSPETLLQFKQEFRVMNKLKHPNTVNVFDYGLMPDKSPYLTMEVVPGKELADIKDMDYTEICRILMQLCQALSFIHSRLLVHCDIKPQNIRLKEDGSVKVMDFGLMNQLGLRSNGQITGTVDYLPPEIPTGGIINASSDLYSVGVVAYELVTGRLPFEGDSVLEVIRAHINSRVTPPSEFRQDIPDKLEKIILKLLEKSQQERYQAASEVIADLVELSGEEFTGESLEQKRSYLSSSVLVGRDKELKILETALAHVEKGYGKAIFVAAPAGVGKSRLIQEFKLQVQLAENPFLTGHCFEQGMSAYKPVADALKQLLPLTNREELEKYGNVLVKILPELQEKGYEPLPNLQGISEKLRLFDTITAWLTDVSTRETLVIFIDDLHWIDQASIDLLNTCIRDLRKSKVMFMGTFRDDEVPAGHPLWQTFEEELTSLVKLDPFTTDDIRALIKAMLGSIDLKNEFVEHVKNATGGNAFFISEVMRYLVEEGILQIKFTTWHLPADYTSWELPTSIEATVNRRLNTLSPKAMELIRLAAVAGRKLRLSLFKAVSGWEEEEIFSAIDELIERQFLNRLEHEYLFPHDRVRETLYDSLEEGLRKELHQKVAETIEAENINQLINVSGELAYHFSRSNDIKKAIKYLLMAGFSSPVRMEASMLLQEATGLLEKTEEDIAESWLNTYLFEICSRDEKVVKQNREEAGSNFNSRFILELAWKKLAWISYMIAPKICLDTSEKLIKALENKGLGLEVTAEFQSIRASSYTMIGQNEKAFSITDPVIESEEKKDSLVRGLMLFGRLNGLLTMGRFRQLVQDMEEAVEILEINLSKLHPPLVWAYGFSSFIRDDGVAWLGEPVGESKYAETVTEIAKKYNHLDLDFWSYYPDIVRYSLTGHYDKIKALQEKLMNMVKRMGKPIQHENRFNICLAFAAIQNGQLLEAKSMTKKIAELGQRLGNPHQQANGLILEAMILMEENKFSEAIELFKQAVNLSQTESKGLKNDQLIPALYRLSEAYLRNHEIDQASEFAEKAHELAFSDQFDNPYHLTNTYRLLGQIHAEKKDYEQAHDMLMKSAAIARNNEIIFQEALTQLVIGEIWLERKKFDLTRTTWQKAIAKFREINNEYQANKLIPRLNSVPKPSLITKNITENKESSRSEDYDNAAQQPSQNMPRDSSQEQAAEIGYKLLDLLSAMGITGGKNQIENQNKVKQDVSSFHETHLLEKLKKVELLNNFGQMLLSSLDLNTVLNNVIERVLEVSEADRGFLILLNEKGELYSQIIRTKEGSSSENRFLNFSKTFTEEVLKTGKPLWVADAQADSRFATQKSVLALDLRTVLCVPLKDKDIVIGLLYVDRQSVIKTFSEDDLNLVESIATFASIAIVNARLHHQANEKNEKLQMLNELSRTISNAFTREELLYKVLGFAIRITGAGIGYVLTGDDLKCEASLDVEGNNEIEVKVSSSVIKKVLETNKSVSLVDTMDDKSISTQASIIALDIRSVMCVPLISNKKTLGVIYLSSKTLVKSFTARDLSLLEDIVGQTALAIENLTLLEVQIKQDQIKKELDIARKIQKSMLPSADPEFEHIEISGYSCSATEVGGDYYDYIMLDDNRFALAFGDVTGHGVSAGLLMAMAKSCMFVQCKVDPNVIPVMTALNEMILGGKSERRIRMGFLYTIFDLKDNTMTISSAGHPLPYYYKHENRDLEPIKVIPGYQLGVKENTKFRETTIQLAHKDVLVYFTDGIVEARNKDNEEYGYDRFEEFIKNNCFLSSKDLKDAILEEYYNWVAGLEEMDDDMTIVVIKVKPPAGEKPSDFISV